MSDPWRILEAMQLGEVGRHGEALERAAADADVAAVLCHAARRSGPAAASPSFRSALHGWAAYFTARYAQASAAFQVVWGDADAPVWLQAWVALGISKVATDIGDDTHALVWCAQAHALARQGEHRDHLAACAGARGEILLRAGQAMAAAQAFSEDLALLPAGSRFRGRVRCCLAHAWARLGCNGRQAALVAYRLAAHTPGETGTRTYAAAGLALLGVRLGEASLVAEALSWQPQGMAAAWCHIANARFAADPRPSLAAAWEQAPPEYLYERAWLYSYARTLGVELASSQAVGKEAPVVLPDPRLDIRWRLVGPIDTVDLPQQLPLDQHPDPWAARDRFMP